LPYLLSAGSSPTDYGKYQCRVINNFRTIYDQIEGEYIENGKICGQTISQITKNGMQTDASSNDISEIQSLVKKGRYVGDNSSNPTVDRNSGVYSFLKFQTVTE
jgi:hypothetical protein